MEVADVLQKVGLANKEAAVYLALLELGTATVRPIATKAGIKRPTAYLILDQLQQKGIVSIVPRAKKALYTAEPPEKLVSDLRKKEELLKSSLPNLLALYNARKEKPQVQLFEGLEGVKLIYEKILAAGAVWFFGTAAEIEKLEPGWTNNFFKRIKNMNFTVKDLMAGNETDIKIAKSKERTANYHIKFIPRGMDFPSDSAIFGDSVAFFSFHPQVFCVVISSRDIAQSLKTLHQLAWQAGKFLPQEKPPLGREV